LNILFLIGNGFDINLGLKTNLYHVIEKVIAEETNEQDIVNLKEKLKDKKDLWWSDFELQLGQHTKEFSSETIACYDKQINHIVKTIRELFGKQESRINYDENKSFIAKSFMKHISNFYSYLPDTKKQIVLNYMNSFYTGREIFYNFLTFNYTSVLDNFIKCSLNEYPKNDYSTKLPINSQKEVTHILQNIIHIHGTLENSLILGVDNTEQIANKQLAGNNSFVPKIVKLETINTLGLNSAMEAKELIDNSNIIIVFGMSIGITDKYWWYYIINWLAKATDRYFILFVYDDKMDKTSNITKINTIENARNKIFSVLDSSVHEAYNACNDRIFYIIEQKDMFKIEDIFYSKKDEHYYNTSSHNGYNLTQALKNITPKELTIMSEAVKNVTPEAIRRMNDLMKGFP
jgi:hypothetical protein